MRRLGLSMMPKSSRSHSTAVPAASMTASTPHVTAPACRQATTGNVPWSPRRAKSGRSGPTHTSSMPPVPNVILPRPGVRIPVLPGTPAGRRSATRSGRARQRRGQPHLTGGVHDPGQGGAGDAQSVQHLVVPVGPLGRVRPVTAAFDRSVTWSSPPENRHASQVSTVPTPRFAVALGVGRVEQVGGLGGGLVWARSAVPAPATPGSRPPCAGPASPGRDRPARR